MKEVILAPFSLLCVGMTSFSLLCVGMTSQGAQKEQKEVPRCPERGPKGAQKGSKGAFKGPSGCPNAQRCHVTGAHT